MLLASLWFDDLRHFTDFKQSKVDPCYADFGQFNANPTGLF